MAGFSFTLQPLLELRRRQEQQAQRALALVNQRRLELEQQLRRQQQIIASDKHDLRTRLVGTLETGELRQHAASTVHSMRRAQQLAVELAGLHTRLNDARAALLEATRARRAIELLRDRRYEQWKQQQNRADVAATDELVTIAAARKESS